MKVGMLWFDNDVKADLNTKVERASSYYQKKYGRSPTLCFVHPSMLPENGKEVSSQKGEKKKEKHYTSGNVELRGTLTVLPNHFWIGVNGKAEKETVNP